MIPRGTTPKHTFDVDVDLTTAVEMFITYQQDRRTVLEKQLKDIEVSPESISVKLTQKESLKFHENGGPVRMQIRARFPDGEAIGSNIMSTSVGEILKEGEI